MAYFLGVDVGTSSVKAAAFATDGNLLLQCSQGFALLHPQPGYSEQDADEIYAATVATIQQTIKQMAEPPLAVGLSTAMHSLLCCDAAGAAVSPLITWADNRAALVAKDLEQAGKPAELYPATGVPVHPMSPLCKLLWLKENNATLFNNTAKFTGIKEYIVYKGCGQWLIDSSVASATGLLNIHNLQWDQHILKFIAVDEKKLATVVPPTYTFFWNNENIPQLKGVPIVMGGSDGVLAAFAGQKSARCDVSLSIGTSAALRCIQKQPFLHKEGAVFCYHLQDALFVSGGPSNNGAVLLQWLKETVLQTAETYEALLAKAATVAVGSDGLIMLPYLLGERAPHWTADVSAVFFGATAQHNQAHFVRAAVEGIAFNLLWISESLQLQPGSRIYTTGGFAKSKFWLQLMADVLDCTLLHSDDGAGAALGAAMLAAIAINQPMQLAAKPTTRYEPDSSSAGIYKKQYVTYRKIFKSLQEAGLFNTKKF